MTSRVAALVRSGLLAPRSLAALVVALVGQGGNLAALARFAAWRYGDAPAIGDDARTLTYRALWREAGNLAATLSAHGVSAGDAIGLGCRNTVADVTMLFAAARLRLTIVLINPDVAVNQRADLAARQRLRAYAGDVPLALTGWRTVELGDHCLSLAPADGKRDSTFGEIVVMTGGTTGMPKAARRRPSFRSFASLFVELVARVGLARRRAVFVATPLHHGFGLAAVLIAVALGKMVHIRPRFDAAETCGIIARERIDAITVVPTMLQRILTHPGADLTSLACVISGGAPLDPALALHTRNRLGECLFNLYGTSEAGVCVIASPSDLRAVPGTIGRAIAGLEVAVIDRHDTPVADGQIGRLSVRSRAAVRGGGWIDTGDLAWRDARGYLFLRGRSDEMIVSGGENVYPIELETILLDHRAVAQAAAIGIADAEFGQRLTAFVAAKPDFPIDAMALRTWLDMRTSAHQRPVAIAVLPALPLTAMGKVDKRALADLDRSDRRRSKDPP